MIVAASGIDWTIVLTALIPTIPAILAVLLGASNRRSLKTASGDPIGQVVERAHDLTAVGLLAAGLVHPGPKMTEAAARLNEDTTSPVKVTLTPAAPSEQATP